MRTLAAGTPCGALYLYSRTRVGVEDELPQCVPSALADAAARRDDLWLDVGHSSSLIITDLRLVAFSGLTEALR